MTRNCVNVMAQSRPEARNKGIRNKKPGAGKSSDSVAASVLYAISIQLIYSLNGKMTMKASTRSLKASLLIL